MDGLRRAIFIIRLTALRDAPVCRQISASDIPDLVSLTIFFWTSGRSILDLLINCFGGSRASAAFAFHVN